MWRLSCWTERLLAARLAQKLLPRARAQTPCCLWDTAQGRGRWSEHLWACKQRTAAAPALAPDQARMGQPGSDRKQPLGKCTRIFQQLQHHRRQLSL